MKAFRKAAFALPAAALIVGGSYMTVDAVQADLPDVAIGGVALAAVGAELGLLSTARSRNINLFKDKSYKITLKPGDRMALFGLAASTALGGGEIVRMSEAYGITTETIGNADLWKDILKDPASIKVLANVTAFPIASIMDFSAVEKAFKKAGLEKTHRVMQTGLFFAGNMMIANFGELAGIASARFSGELNAAASLTRLGQLAGEYTDENTKTKDWSINRNHTVNVQYAMA